MSSRRVSAFRCHKLDTKREDASIMLRRGGTRRKMRLKVDAGFAMFFFFRRIAFDWNVDWI